MDWIQLKVNCKVVDLETVSSVMSMLDNYIMIEDYSDIDTDLKTVYGDLIDEKIKNADKTVGSCSIYVPEDKNINEYKAFIDARLSSCQINYSYETIIAKEEDWSTAWRKYYKPTEIGENIVIVPSWEKYDNTDNKIVIDMDPGMAFGTGTHETTQLCATLLEKEIKKDDVVLDVGSGSGILAICASKLGAKQCFACDIDSVAVRIEKENFDRNNCNNIECSVSDLFKQVPLYDGKKYDIVIANIVADIIIRLSEDVKDYLKEDGLFIVSGIIDERQIDVDKALSAKGLTKVDEVHKNGWCAEVFKN